MELSEFRSQTLLLDLETTRTGKIRHVGAILNGRIFEKFTRGGSKTVLEDLNEFAEDSVFVLGHNLLGHDFPILKTFAPWLELLEKPVIDTLYLSPIAFPQNPYHRLVKDYKLVRSSISSPVEDAKIAASVFEDQWHSFAAISERNAELIDFYRFCFQDGLFNGFPGIGLSMVFSAFVPTIIRTADDAFIFFKRQTDGLVCGHSAEEKIPELLSNQDKRPEVAYTLAWLQVAGGNSVLPPWVRHRFAEIPPLIKSLRERPCVYSDCGFCKQNHDADRQLFKFFGFSSFREKPMTRQGESLQKAIVTDSMGDTPVMGILPTGGGKSLCYQLPALIRYWRRGTLTVVISPLLSLMKDQVDNLIRKTGTLFAEAVFSLQTPPERGEVFERIRLGDTAILYISPEQLRSMSVQNVLKQREVGCWVFDEAHCLSKWGHDFRPDYLYAARFIREFSIEQNQPVPPIYCFTATAKKSVIEEIKTHFQKELDQELRLYMGGIERENLSFEVIPVSQAEKFERTLEIVNEQLNQREEPTGIIIYVATRKATGEISEFLKHQGLIAEAFHGGLEAKDKRDTIESFISGEVPVICATNAFGMGIDKENVRLVLHYDIPGSLENYIQEAGRAGRDMKPARCVLLYDSQDVTRQFHLGAITEIRRKEIARILRALRRKKKTKKGEIIITSDELVRDEDWPDFEKLKPELRDTKIKTAVAWLERAGFLERNQNLTDLFQGEPLVTSLEETIKIIDRLDLRLHTRKLWLNILQFIINSKTEQGIRADSIAEALFPEKSSLKKIEEKSGLTAAQVVITALHDMADAGLLSEGIMLSATFRPKGKNNALKVLRSACDIENKMLDLLQEEDPDAENGSWVSLHIRRLNQRLNNEGYETTPEVLRQLVKGISYDGKGFAASLGSFEIKYVDRNLYQVRLQRSWQNVRKTVALRQDVSRVILDTLLLLADKKSAEEKIELKGNVHITFTSNDLSTAISSNIILSDRVNKILPAIDRALMFLHEQKAIQLQGGLAILRQAMNITLAEAARGRYYRKGDYKPLEVHYREKRLQVHVMMRYATLALEKISAALILVFDYFALARVDFINKYFDEDKELLEKATTAESYRMIVETLRNPVQISAVGKPLEDNMLILAGPGSGKTKVIIHRCAYLVEVERVPARQILVLCFNHSSAMELRKRLLRLVGRVAWGITVATYHGAAMRLAGISIRDMIDSENVDHIDFEGIIKRAITLLKGELEIPGIEPDEMRDRMLSGYSHILVDEYQDIDEDQYELVSAIAGKSLEEEGSRLTLLAVGDDDQNIYTFRGANVHFIRRFQEDYETEIIYLVENYRSSKHIISASNALIRNNKDRMKTSHPICINRERAPISPGGRWTKMDVVSKGRVQIVSVRNLLHQAAYIKYEINRIKRLDPKAEWSDFAILSRTKSTIAVIRSVLEKSEYPFRTTLDTALPIHKVREVHLMMEFLKKKEKDVGRVSDIKKELVNVRRQNASNIWWELIDGFLDAYQEETDDSLQPISRAIDHFYEFLSEKRREKVFGHGIFLSTIHSAKGMEFPHVFVLDGDWGLPRNRAEWEEERRVLYVAMTRAEETLRLMSLPKKPNPLLREIKGDFVLRINFQGDLQHEGADSINKRYEVLELNDIYMDYAGTFPGNHPIHFHLDGLGSSGRVALCLNHSKIEIRNSKDRCIGRLSKEGASKWSDRLEQVIEARVLAMLRRDRDDPDAEFIDRIRVDQWEVPLLEVVLLNHAR